MDTKCDDILSVLYRKCQTYPLRPAVVEGDSIVLSYQQLWQQARRVAEYVNRHGGSCPFVGLNLPKSTAYIVSMIGCWMAGKAFIPIGTDLPTARQKFIMDHAEISVCLDKETYDKAMSCSMTNTVAPCSPEQWAYMIYSSGTTGTPKGILVSHAGLCNLAGCQRQTFGVDHLSRYLFFLSVNFDASISDILVTLTSGATLVIEPLPQEELASRLYEVIEKRKVTHTDIPPSLLKMLDPNRCPDYLQTIIIGGEAADIDTVRRWSRKVRLINVYGPTEATICTSICQCDAQWNAPLLGHVLNHTHYSVYADGKLDATDGELWISGIGLAVGYYKNEELTREKFPVVEGTRYYRTADHVRINRDGELEFVGRIDRQVKYHGQLIELEEIEHTLREDRYVGNVAVVKRKVGSGNAKEVLVAFIQLTDNTVSQTDVEHRLRQHCKHRLPRWMMPTFFEFVNQMPVTPSGKPDLRTLSTMPLNRAIVVNDCQYLSKEEETIAQIMADILNIPAMGATDNFYLCGGDSLDTILLISKLQQMGIIVTSAELHQASTPRLLARRNGQSTSMCTHSTLLEPEWQYSPTPDGQSAVTNNTHCLLITGTTGFLGSHLLVELLNRDKQSKVKCLVRCPSTDIGKERIGVGFHRYGLDTSLLERVEIVRGDITLPRLGLPAEVYERLCEEVSAVFHCAATVNMLAPYEDLKETNVTGTKNILDFCMAGRRKALHFASTLSVFVSTDRNTGTVYENDNLNTPTNIYGGYAQTKFVAEKMVHSIPPANCDTFIYRYGLLCGDTMRGKSAPKDFLGMFLRGAKRIGTLPYDPTHAMAIDITPIDQASRIVGDIAMQGTPSTYHIASDNPLNYNRLCSILKEEGFIRDIVDYEQWMETVRTFEGNADVQAVHMALCRMDATLFRQMRYMDLFQTTGIRFDMTNTYAATTHRCVQTDNLIKLYIKRLHETI